jgi:hypothetical protein
MTLLILNFITFKQKQGTQYLILSWLLIQITFCSFVERHERQEPHTIKLQSVQENGVDISMKFDRRAGRRPQSSPETAVPAVTAEAVVATSGDTPPTVEWSPKGGSGVSVLKGGALAVAPMAVQVLAENYVRNNYDEAAHARLENKGAPTEEQINLQRYAGYEYTGQLDEDNRPVWRYAPGWKTRLRNAAYLLLDWFNPPNPRGSWDWPYA